MRSTAFLSLVLLLGGCSTVHRTLDREGELIDSPARNWRQVATRRDQDRLHDWRAVFAAALADARRAGAGTGIDAEGALLQPDAAIVGPALPFGEYRCRTIKVGAKAPGLPSYTAYPTASCQVRRASGLRELATVGGVQRPVGLIFPADALRSVFLGTLMVGDEERAMQYGGDPDRDMAGYVERIGPRRWRLVLPRPAFQSQLDVIELVPVS